jgi:hypothetical protein
MTDTKRDFTGEARRSFSTHIPEGLIRRVLARAAMEERTVADITAMAIAEYLERHEVREACGDQGEYGIVTGGTPPSAHPLHPPPYPPTAPVPGTR